MAKDNDIMSETYGEEIPEEPETPWTQQVMTGIVLACIAAIFVAITIKIVRWLLQ